MAPVINQPLQGIRMYFEGQTYDPSKVTLIDLVIKASEICARIAQT